MPRLFVAIAVPEAIKKPLRQAQKYCPVNCRLVKSAAWHVTLQFIGDNEIDAVHECLQGISAEPFEIMLSKPGYFGRLNRGVALWWGVESHHKLVDLQARVRQVLQRRFGEEVIRADKGGYQPHITLARCKTKIPRAAVDDFLRQPALDRRRFSVQTFGLYSSKTDSGGATYTLEKSYPLKVVT